MKRLAIAVSLSLSLAFPAWSAKAQPKPAAKKKPAATVTTVVGSPQLSPDGKAFKKAKVGQALSVGTQIRTGKGKMTLLMSEGSTVRLIENTDITLKSHNPGEDKGGTVFKVVKGFGRFVVQKLAKGKHFNVETSNAVAAVKGTDFEAGVDEQGETEVNVFDSETNGAVELFDIEGEKSVLIEENEQGSFNGSEFKEESFTQEEQKQSEQQYEGLPEDVGTGAGEGGGEGAPVEGQEGAGQGGEGAAAEGEEKAAEGGEEATEGGEQAEEAGEQAEEAGAEAGEETAGMEEMQEEFLEEVYEAFYEDQYLDNQQTQAEQAGDQENQRLVVDHKGYAALVGNRISRPDAYSVMKEALVYREYGPDAGYSGATESTYFNDALPFDWPSVYNMALDDPANLNIDGYPNYFRTGQYFYAFNNYGDYIYIDTMFDDPHFMGAGPGVVQQGFHQSYLVNGVDKGTLGYYADDVVPTGYSGLLGYYPTSVQGLDLNCPNCFDEYPYTSTVNADGSISIEHRQYVTFPTLLDQELFTMTFRAHDDDGVQQSLSSLLGSAPANHHGFRGLGWTNLNLSLVFSAPEFGGREIDLIYLPGYFDSFEILTPMPAGFDATGGS